MKNIAIYCRVSTAVQAEKETIEIQKQHAKSYADLMKLNIVDMYADDGISGSIPFADRPEGKKLLKAAKDKKFDTVVIYKIDRLARNTRDALNVAHILKEYDIGLKSITESFDTTPSGHLMFTVMSSFAELERSMISSRLSDGRQRKYENGQYVTGAVPYGLKRDKDRRLVPDTELIPGCDYSPAEIVKIIFEKSAHDNIGIVKTAEWLSQIGIPARNKPNWEWADVYRIIHNEKYKGDMIVNRLSKKYEEFIISIPQIVSRDLWQAANDACRKRKKVHTRKGIKYLLNQGIMRCGYCGQSYSGVHEIKKNTDGNYVYRCVGRVSRAKYFHRKKCNQGRQIQALKLEDTIWEECVTAINNPNTIKDSLERYFNSLPNAAGETQQQLINYKKSLRTLSQERKRLVDNLIKERITENEFDEMAAQNKASTDDISARINILEQRQAKEIDIKSSVAAAQAMFKTIKKELISPADFDTKYRIIHNVIDHIIIMTEDINNAKIDIFWNVNDCIKTFGDNTNILSYQSM